MKKITKQCELKTLKFYNLIKKLKSLYCKNQVSLMVLSPFHYTIPWILHKMARKRGKKTNLPFLGLTAMVHDLELIPLFLIGFAIPYNRYLLHSIFGSLTIVLLLALILSPLWFMAIKKVFKLKFKFKLHKLDIPIAFFCSFIHVIIDATHHRYVPLFAPFSSESFNGLVLFGDWIASTLIMQSIFGISFAIIIIYEIRRSSSMQQFAKSFFLD